MLHIPESTKMVSMSVRVPPETAEAVRELAKDLSKGSTKVTDAAVLRQIIVDFFAQNRIRNVIENEAIK